MTDVIAIVAAGVALIGAIVAVIGSYRQKMEDAESHGRVLQRVDNVEEDVTHAHDKIREIQKEHSKTEQALTMISTNQAALKELIESKFDNIGREISELKADFRSHENH
jgi:predicted  nucleic acid-binding Zn-ribbon protein